MIRRILKEYRMMWPFAAIYLGVGFGILYAASGVSPGSGSIMKFVWPQILFPVAGILLGVSLFGSEFTHGTMPRLLSEPIHRRRIWWEKIAAAAVIFVVVLVPTRLAQNPAFDEAKRLMDARVQLSTPESVAATNAMLRAGGHLPEEVPIARIFYFRRCLQWEVLAFLIGLTVGPLMSLRLRQTHVAFWAGIVGCMIWYILEQAFDGFLLRPLFGFSLLNDLTGRFQPYRVVLIYLPPCLAAYVVARKTFLRLEV